MTTTTTPDVVLEFFYLDLDTCNPCQTAGRNVARAVEQLGSFLSRSGRILEVKEVHLDDADMARVLGVVGSPTVRVNGVDVYLPVEESHCGTCSSVVDEPIDCRTFVWDGNRLSAPPTDMIVAAVRAQLESPGTPAASVPVAGGSTSVERFLAAKARRGTAAAELRELVRGTVAVAGDPGWDEVRGTYNLVVDQQPEVIVVPADAEDVVSVIRYATERGVQVVPQRSGHNAEPLGSLAGTILLRTDALRWVHIDTDRRLARVGAGAKWEDVVPRASELGFAALHGSTPDVSIAGYSMGGGLGWYARAWGLATNSVTRIEIVTPDGRLRWVDHEHEPDLFWALRGGGGNFGVVTAIEFRLYPLREVYAGILFFPWERSAEILHAWERWTRTVPDEMTSVGRIMQFPADDEVPEPLRGRSFVFVEGFYLGDEATGRALLEPLRELGPVLDTFAMQPPVGIAELHMDPPLPLPYQTDHLVLRDLTPEAIDDLVAVVGPESGSELISVEIRHLGGALSRDEPHHGALSRLPGEYLLFGIGVTPDAASIDAVHARLRGMKASVDGLAGGLYYNFTENEIDPAEIFSPETYRRLQDTRTSVDPHGIIRAAHSIPVKRTL